MATKKAEAKGIKSVEVGYRVLLAVQRGPGSVQLSEIAKRAGLGSGAAHNYITSLVRTGLVEQEGRGFYRLGPSAFALSLTSYQQLNGYDILKSEAEALHDLTGESVAVSVWSQGGPVSVFIRRSNNLGMLDFRPGLVPITRSAVGMLFAGYLPASLTGPVIAEDRAGHAGQDSSTFMAQARAAVRPLGYAYFARDEDRYYALAVPVWIPGGRIAFALSIVSRTEELNPAVDSTSLERLRESADRASMFLAGTSATGPVAESKGGGQLG